MKMMIAPNSLVRQNEKAQGEKEEEDAGGRRKGGLTGTPMPGADVPTGPTRERVLLGRQPQVQVVEEYFWRA